MSPTRLSGRITDNAADEFATVLPAILTYLTSLFRFVRCAQTRDDTVAGDVGLC